MRKAIYCFAVLLVSWTTLLEAQVRHGHGVQTSIHVDLGIGSVRTEGALFAVPSFGAELRFLFRGLGIGIQPYARSWGIARGDIDASITRFTLGPRANLLARYPTDLVIGYGIGAAFQVTTRSRDEFEELNVGHSFSLRLERPFSHGRLRVGGLIEVGWSRAGARWSSFSMSLGFGARTTN